MRISQARWGRYSIIFGSGGIMCCLLYAVVVVICRPRVGQTKPSSIRKGRGVRTLSLRGGSSRERCCRSFRSHCCRCARHVILHTLVRVAAARLVIVAQCGEGVHRTPAWRAALGPSPGVGGNEEVEIIKE
eukprot:scaffold21543_cov30-Tisochrysis_lutea.AAC.4